MGRILQPFMGKCLPASWYNVSSPDYPGTVTCPAKLVIRGPCGSSSGCYDTNGLFINPRGTWIGYCLRSSTGSDAYVTEIHGLCSGVNYHAFIVDVWGMYRDGLWTSSLAIPVAATRTSGGTGSVSAGIGDETLVNTNIARCYLGDAVSKTVTFNTTCVTTTLATVTVYDDGTFSIA